MKKIAQLHRIKIILGYLHMYGSCRFWTTTLTPTHCAIINRCPNSPDSVAGVFVKCKDEEEALRKVRIAKENKQYGMCFYYTGMLGGLFGYAVHFPRFVQEKDGFINFHVFKAIQKIRKGSKFKILLDSDHKRYEENVLKKVA